MLYLSPDACPHIRIGIPLHAAACGSEAGKIILLCLSVSLKLKPACLQHRLFIHHFGANTFKGRFLKNDPAEFFYRFRAAVFQRFRWICNALRLVLGSHIFQSDRCGSHDRVVTVCIVGGIIYKSFRIRS